MKTCSIIFLILFLASNFVKAQSRIKIPLIKENSEIDNLLKLILNPKTKKQYVSDHQNRKLDCIMIRFEKEKYGKRYSFLISTQTHLALNKIINRVKDHLGYFKFKNYNVFIWSLGDLSEFVQKTSEIKTFSYIYRISNLNSSIDAHDGNMWSYNYLNGRFTIDNPPILR